eukprot:TRINITY_DN63176_c0_g1_i1.p1 TRINITY_DN63176_c0_g1~~TRINITY_DN63176_c0_g1_i1.p1  ORF type:complete len:404 (-),score=60.86 TRINITY_DN63176_c0_g1_i1:52-1263(-)
MSGACSRFGMVACAVALLLSSSVCAASRVSRKASLRGDRGAIRVKSQYPFYHTSDEISTELRRLATACKDANFEVKDVHEGNSTLEVVSVSRKGVSKRANRVLVISGEHARELIGSESTIRFLQALCGEAVVGDVTASNALADSEFMVIVNANPISRSSVEQGDYCLRENPSGVDLNRNWDEHRDAPMTVVTELGQAAWSEPETRIMKKVAEDFMPTTYISVHSGTVGMYMPWAWTTMPPEDRREGQMMELLETLDAKYCKCPFGAAGKEVGYPCPGTSVDWIYDKLNASFAFAFEIWGDPDLMSGLRSRWEEKVSGGGYALLQRGAHLAHSYFEGLFGHAQSDFVQLAEASASVENAMEAEMCFSTYNPTEVEQYNRAIDNWAALYMETAATTGERLLAARR